MDSLGKGYSYEDEFCNDHYSYVEHYERLGVHADGEGDGREHSYYDGAFGDGNGDGTGDGDNSFHFTDHYLD